jgi:hypothetical protein
MKRWIALACCVLTLFAAVGCAKQQNQDPVARYTAAMQKTNALESSSVTMDLTAKVSAQGMSMDVTGKYDTKVVQKGEDDFDLAMNIEMGMLGVTMNINTYYTDGYAYVDAMGQKVKSEMDIKEALQQMNSSGQLFQLKPEDFSEFKAEQIGGDEVYTFKADPEKMKDLVNKMLSQMSSSMGEGADEDLTADMEIKEFSGKATVNSQGYLSKMEVNMNLEMDVEGQTAGTDVSITATYNQPGEKVEITFPDFSDYQESDDTSLIA